MIVRFMVALFTLCLVIGCSKDDASRKRLKGYILDKEPRIEKKLNVDFDGKLELLGYKFNTKSPKPDKKVKLTLYWRVKQKLDEDMRLTTHVLDASGERLVSLDDRGPLREKKGGKRTLPLSAWEPGKIYVDEQPFKFPSKVKTDRFQIVAGVYKGKERVAIKSGPKDAQNRVVVVNMPFSRSSESKSKTPKFPSVRVSKLDAKAKIKVDGKLDEPEWETAARIGPFVDVATGQPNKTFPVNGRAKLLWNEQNLYVGFEVEDKDVVGGFPKTAKDPHLWTKDTVEIMADPDGDGDNQDYYEIQVGPQNLVFDSQFDKYNEPKTEPDGPFGHQDWSSALKSAVVVDGTLDKPGDEDKGYVVELAIPWKSFSKAKQVPPRHGDNWRMNFYAMQENSGVAWSPILGQGNFHKASRFGKVSFVDPAAVPDAGATDAGATDAGAAPALSASGARRPFSPAPRAAPAASAP
ncbi:MAG TPA: carbohydrate-binding family 9-like protein [Polyangiaceae bacterium]